MQHIKEIMEEMGYLESKEEKRKEQNKKSCEKFRGTAGRPKKYYTEEERKEANKIMQRRMYRKKSAVERDLTTRAGRLGAWQDLIDAM